jgi:hypothetical protein
VFSLRKFLCVTSPVVPFIFACRCYATEPSVLKVMGDIPHYLLKSAASRTTCSRYTLAEGVRKIRSSGPHRSLINIYAKRPKVYHIFLSLRGPSNLQGTTWALFQCILAQRSYAAPALCSEPKVETFGSEHVVTGFARDIFIPLIFDFPSSVDIFIPVIFSEKRNFDVIILHCYVFLNG